jgi:hypothetical protein
MDNNFLAKAFDWVGEVFERFNPSAYRFLGAVLPYLTPLPVAWLTAHSAEKFLGFTPSIAFIFVFVLEGIGLWFTSLLVDSVVDWIRSRNWKTGAITVVLGVAVFAYMYLLVSLNVLLKENDNVIYSQVVTLLCFLPLISGIGNGYYKLKLKADTLSEEARIYERTKEEKVREDKKQAKLETKLLKHGIDPRQPLVQQYQETVPAVRLVVKSDWRLLNESERNLVRHNMSVPEIMEKHQVSRATAFEWKKK